MPVNFENLDVYQKAVAFANAIYRETKKFPASEQFGLVSQLRRAAVSIAANIAEGSGRRSVANQMMFYLNARGSLYECLPLLRIATDQQFIDKQSLTELRYQADEVIRLLNGLLRYLKSPRSMQQKIMVDR